MHGNFYSFNFWFNCKVQRVRRVYEIIRENIIIENWESKIIVKEYELVDILSNSFYISFFVKYLTKEKSGPYSPSLFVSPNTLKQITSLIFFSWHNNVIPLFFSKGE